MCKLNADLICIELKNCGVLMFLKIIFTATAWMIITVYFKFAASVSYK